MTNQQELRSPQETKAAIGDVIRRLSLEPRLSTKGEITYWTNEFWRANQNLRLKETRRWVARTLGYGSWARLKKVFQQLDYLPNIALEPNPEISALLEQMIEEQAADTGKQLTPAYRALPSPALPPVLVRKKRTFSS